MFPPMPKARRPDSNQLAALIVAKAAGLPVPAGAREFEHLVKKVSKKAPKKRK